MQAAANYDHEQELMLEYGYLHKFIVYFLTSICL